ncbi:hypothetical protein HBP99_15205 [Listeria booriae]|uniref:hypothetical protein n=1 Tax=Listeria booriae TaxID=1552123 RepID=UPI00162AD0E2|nr:hypothetical protein [Listeria booriae]MBC2369975.1 hypothetical protein [Listeria booriae]
MKKLIMIMIAASLLVFSVPVAAHAQKDIAVENVGIYNSSVGSNKKFLRSVPKGAIVNYLGNGKLTYLNTTGFTLLTERLCPVSSNGWYAAVMKRSVRLPGDQGSASSSMNDVVRVKPTVTKKISGVTYVKCAVYNDGWFWNFWIKPGDVVRVDGYAYNSIVRFTSM